MTTPHLCKHRMHIISWQAIMQLGVRAEVEAMYNDGPIARAMHRC